MNKNLDLIVEMANSVLPSRPSALLSELKQYKLDRVFWHVLQMQDRKDSRLICKKLCLLDQRGLTALELCVASNLVELIWVALERGNRNGPYALHLALRFGYFEIARLLIGSGLDVNTLDQTGQTPLHYVAYFLPNDSQKDLYIETAVQILDAGGVIDALDQFCFTPLHVAANHGNMTMVKLLIQKGAALNFLTHEGRMAIHIAAINKNRELVWELFHANAQLGGTASQQQPLIDFCYSENSTDCWLLMLERGLNITLLKREWPQTLENAFSIIRYRANTNTEADHVIPHIDEIENTDWSAATDLPNPTWVLTV